jgi:hypothetical protein
MREERVGRDYGSRLSGSRTLSKLCTGGELNSVYKIIFDSLEMATPARRIPKAGKSTAPRQKDPRDSESRTGLNQLANVPSQT